MHICYTTTTSPINFPATSIIFLALTSSMLVFSIHKYSRANKGYSSCQIKIAFAWVRCNIVSQSLALVPSFTLMMGLLC